MSKIARPPLPTLLSANTRLVSPSTTTTTLTTTTTPIVPASGQQRSNDDQVTKPLTSSLSARLSKATSSSHQDSVPSTPSQDKPLVVGCRVTVSSMNVVGTLRFLGKTQFKTGLWAGIELDTIGAGKNDGSVQGIQYFQCAEQTGLFILASKVSPVPEPTSVTQRQGRERIKTHVRPVASKSARVSSKASSTPPPTPPLPVMPTAAKRSITTRLPNNKASITTRSPKTRASASPVVQRQHSTTTTSNNSPVRPRTSALPSVKRTSTSSTDSAMDRILAKRASAVRISVSNTTTHGTNANVTTKKDTSMSFSPSSSLSDDPLSSSPSNSSLSSPHTQSTTTTTLNTASSSSPPPAAPSSVPTSASPLSSQQQTTSPPSPSAHHRKKTVINMDEMHQLYELLQRTQREKDLLVEQIQNKDAAFERLVSAKESYALQVEEKDHAMARLQQQMTSQEQHIDNLTQKLAVYEEKQAQQLRDDATEEQYVRRVQKLESLVATLQEQASQAAQQQEEKTRAHQSQLDLVRRELEQEKEISLSLERECDTLRKTELEAIRAYEDSVAQLKHEHAYALDEKELYLRQTQAALDHLKRQLHSFDMDAEDDDDNDNMRLLIDHDGLQPGSSPSPTSRRQHEYNLEARSWSEQRHRLEDQLDLTMTELENERATMRTLITELETLREEIKQSRQYQQSMNTQYSALQQEMAKEIEEKRRLMEEADAAFEAQAKAEDDLYQMKLTHSSMEKEWQDALQKINNLSSSSSSSASSPTNTTVTSKDDDDTGARQSMVTPNLLQQQLKELEQQAAHWKEQYHSMEQECMRLMDEMLAMADDPSESKTKPISSPSSLTTVKSLEQQLKQAKHDHEHELLAKQVEIQKLGKELADLESLVETNVFGQGDTEEQLEKERNKVKQLEKQLARFSSSSSHRRSSGFSVSSPTLFCSLCDCEGHDISSCQEFKSQRKTKLYCEYCDDYGDHLTQDCPDQDETF